MSAGPLFERVALIGIGLIGSSLARRMRRDGLARTIVCNAKSERSRKVARELGIVDAAYK
jgi:cyclohexadieny/prephenate dehydrogenase